MNNQEDVWNSNLKKRNIYNIEVGAEDSSETQPTFVFDPFTYGFCNNLIVLCIRSNGYIYHSSLHVGFRDPISFPNMFIKHIRLIQYTRKKNVIEPNTSDKT
jgi:hypothetical protein